MAEPKQVKVIKGGLNIAKRLLDDGEGAGLTASQRAEAGRKAAELIKSQPQVKASEALGQLMEKGFKKTTTTQADRTRVGGGNIGGAPFPAISEADPAYKGKVWGVMDEGTAARLKNLTDDETAWTTMLGSANQLKTNPIVFDKLKRGFVDSMKQGNLSDELASKINHNLALTFGEGADIRDPKIWRQADTFEKRAALADVMMGQGTAPSKGGIAIGGEKSGKGVIFKPTDILKRETEPYLLHSEHGGDVPTFAAGPRLFRLNKESVYDPSLHPGFPTLLTGEDLKINMKPTPTEVYLHDWHQRFKKNNPDRKGPGYYDLALGVKGEGLPSQDLNDEYIRHLLREGFKDGGSVDIDAADARLSAAIEKRMAKGGAVDIEAADARLADAISARMADGGKVVKGLGKIAKKLMADEVPVTEAAKGKTQALLKNNFGPAFGAYGYTDDILRRERGSFAGNFGLDYGQKLAPSFEFVPIKNLKVTEKVVDAKVRSLMDAIKESGNTLDNQIPPVIVDSNGNVLDGHHRIEAARRLGYEQVPVIEKFDIQNGPQLGDEYADGGKVVKGAAKVFKKLFNDDVLPAAERDANLAKMLDKSVAKQRLYHGTPYTDEAINEFEVRGGGDFGPGIYMTNRPKTANMYASGVSGTRNGAVYPVHTQIKNPLKVKDKYEMNGVFDSIGWGKPIHESLRDLGYDGIHVTNPNPKNLKEEYFVAFEPAQVKSAIGNRGTYDLGDPDINKADGGLLHMADAGKVVGGMGKVFRKLLADDVVNGMRVRKDIPNTSSIGASLTDYSTHGLQEVPMSAFETVGKPRYRNAQERERTQELARQIQQNKELNPLIVVKDAEGHYILEGGHRFDALRELGIDSFPALVVHDLESLGTVAKADGGKVVKGAGKVFKKLFEDAPTESKIIQPPSIIIPSKIGNVKKAIQQSKGEYGARRVERAADEIPNLEKMYKEKALQDAFGGDNAKAMMTMNPADFERYATPVIERTRHWGSLGESDPDKINLPTEDYIKYLRTVGPFDDVPFLEINKQEEGLPLVPFISGHEGRHRNRTLANKGENTGLVQLLPRAELREPFPRRSQEEYIEALKKELEMTNNVVEPQVYFSRDAFAHPPQIKRPAIKLPDIYAKGGLAMASGGIPHMADAGRVFKGMGKLGKKLFADPAESSVTSARRGDRMADQMGGLNIIKEEGGNWREGRNSIANHLKPIRKVDTPRYTHINEQGHAVGQGFGRPMTKEELQREMDAPIFVKNKALNNWIDRNLTNYMKNQMGTKSDPVRKLADQGISHFADVNDLRMPVDLLDPDDMGMIASANKKMREKIGMPANPIAETQMGKNWEEHVDDILGESTYGGHKYATPDVIKDNPWMANLPEGTPFYGVPESGLTDSFNFKHIIDVLNEDLQRNRIRPEQLNKISMEQAVRRVHAYDQQKAEEMAKTAIKNTEGMPVHKEYPEGYKWIELTKPKSKLPEGWENFTDEEKKMFSSLPDKESEKILEDALDYEGKTMGHCVGGYCPDVISGKTRIYSLRDTKGEPHVTVEVEPQKTIAWADVRAMGGDPLAIQTEAKRRMGIDSPEAEKELMKNVSGNSDKRYELNQQLEKHFADVYQEQFGNLPQAIRQIKGKGNRRPVEKYDPYTQDFVQSGKWSNVGDVENTGLLSIERAFPKYEDQKYFSNAHPDKTYLTKDEAKAFHDRMAQEVLDEFSNHRIKPDPGSKATLGRTDLMRVRELAELEFPGDLQRQANMIRGALQGTNEPGAYMGSIHPPEGMRDGGSVFKKIQFMDKGGITTSAGTFSPEELGVNASDIGMSDKRWNKIKSNASELYGEGKEQLEKEYRQLGYKGGKKDFAIRVGSQLLGGGSDLVNLGLMGLDFVQSAIPAISKPESVLDTAGTSDRIPKFKLASDEPWLGSEHFIRKFKEAELLGNKEFPLTEIAAGFVAPAAAANALRKSKQAYKGAKALMDTPKKRRGGLTAMTR